MNFFKHFSEAKKEPPRTGQRKNELENDPSSYRLKKQFFGSNRVGFDIVKDLV